MNIPGFVVAAFLVIILPGQDFMFLVAQSIGVGKKAGVFTALGLAAGNIVTISAIAFGITPLIMNSPAIMMAMKILGVAYILYLAFSAWREKIETTDDGKPQISISERKDNNHSNNNHHKDHNTNYLNNQHSNPNLKNFLRGATMNILNIKAWLFMLLFFPQFLDKHSSTPMLDIAILGLIFITIAMLVFCSIAIISSYFARFFDNVKSRIILKYIRASMMLIIAILVMIQ